MSYLTDSLRRLWEDLKAEREEEAEEVPSIEEVMARPFLETTVSTVMGTPPYVAPEVLLAAGWSVESCRRSSEAWDELYDSDEDWWDSRDGLLEDETEVVSLLSSLLSRLTDPNSAVGT